MGFLRLGISELSGGMRVRRHGILPGSGIRQGAF
jgi:hypothetical protein